VPAGTRQFLLIFHPSGEPRLEAGGAGEYLLEIRDGQGRNLWSGHGLKQSDEGSFVVGVSRRFLPAGDYRFRVVAASFQEEFPLRLKYL
jgi:hypothetical protein